MKTLLTIYFAAVCAFVAAQNKPSGDTRLQGIEADLEKVLSDWKGAGFAVAVVEKDKVVYAKGFGVKDLDTKQPVTPQTLFAIGSCTKAFTAALVGQLVADGKFTYDEPVRHYLPALQFYNSDMNNLITMRDMMSHKTGLPRHDLSWYFNPSENRDTLLMRIQYMEPTYRPKEKYQYNNFMFFAQGVVTEKFTNQSWEKTLREKIFTPLGMARSNSPYGAVKNDPDLASPHAYKNDSTLQKVPHYNIAAMGPAGGVYSSVLEMANWVQTWIYGGMFKGQQVVPSSHYTEAISSQTPNAAGIPDPAHPDISGGNYGFGWSLLNYRGHYRVEHGGAIDGFIASTAFFPTDSIGIVVLSNQSSRQIPNIVRNIVADRMLKLPKFDWNKENLDRRKLENDAVAKAKASTSDPRHSSRMQHAAAEYAGLYTHPAYGTYEVLLRNDSIFMRTTLKELWLQNWHYDLFRAYEAEPGKPVDTTNKSSIVFRFNTSVTGDIESMNAYGFESPAIELEFKRSPKPKAMTKSDLEAYTGEYDLGGVSAKVYIKGDNTLFVEVPGQPPYELVYTGNEKFVFKALPNYAVLFAKKTGEPASALTFLQPQGNFTAKRK
ncbi:MAG: serine hydrolase [Saprospiraceae bacterium]|jgi:CubicO group peptidase (beta-lactamase class C family)